MKQTLARVARGDSGAMQELFEQERAALHRLFLSLGRCASLADDLVQDTFLNLWRFRTNYRGNGSASAYLYRVAVNQWRASLSRDRRRRDAWEDLLADWNEAARGDASADLEARENMLRIWNTIDGLPSEQREVFVLHRQHGLSCPEIADVTNANLKTVESRLRLALAKLIARLRAAEPLEHRTMNNLEARPR